MTDISDLCIEKSFFRRSLPDTCIALESNEGKSRIQRSMISSTAEPFLPLMVHFTTQAEPAYCGLSSLVMVLNSFQIDPYRIWKAPWRFWTEQFLDCCRPLESIKKSGITLGEFACLASCQRLEAELYQPVQSKKLKFSQVITADQFRNLIEEYCSASDLKAKGFLVVSYSRKTLRQTGDGHFSPIAAYDKETDSVLILDVARFKYPPYFVSVPLLYDAMLPLDPVTGEARGLVVLRPSWELRTEYASPRNGSDMLSPDSQIPLIRLVRVSDTESDQIISGRLEYVLSTIKEKLSIRCSSDSNLLSLFEEDFADIVELYAQVAMYIKVDLYYDGLVSSPVSPSSSPSSAQGAPWKIEGRAKPRQLGCHGSCTSCSDRIECDTLNSTSCSGGSCGDTRDNMFGQACSQNKCHDSSTVIHLIQGQEDILHAVKHDFPGLLNKLKDAFLPDCDAGRVPPLLASSFVARYGAESFWANASIAKSDKESLLACLLANILSTLLFVELQLIAAGEAKESHKQDTQDRDSLSQGRTASDRVHMVRLSPETYPKWFRERVQHRCLKNEVQRLENQYRVIYSMFKRRDEDL